MVSFNIVSFILSFKIGINFIVYSVVLTASSVGQQARLGEIMYSIKIFNTFLCC